MRPKADMCRPATEQAAFIGVNNKSKGLQAQFTVEDKKFFTMPWSGSATYRVPRTRGWKMSVPRTLTNTTPAGTLPFPTPTTPISERCPG
jgi:hypothetical protein